MKRKNFKVCIYCLLISIIQTTELDATTYYLSSGGNDNNSGTSIATAWKSIGKLNSIEIKPGDIILFEGGQSFSGNIYIDANDANYPLKTVLFSSYGTGKAIISTSYAKEGFMAYNTQGFIISNLIFEGPGMNSPNKNDGITFYTDLAGDVKLSTISIRNVEVRNFALCGIKISSWAGNTGFKRVLIDSVTVHDIRENGIVSWGQDTQTSVGSPHYNIRVTNSAVYNVTGHSAPGHKGSGIVLAQVDSCLIEKCVSYNNGAENTACGGPGGIWVYSCNNVTIQFCESYKNFSGKGNGCDGFGFDFDGGVTNSVLQYNYSHDNDGAGILLGQYDNARHWGNNVVRYNISVNDARTNNSSITLFKGANCTFNGLKIYHNTVYVTPSAKNTTPIRAFQITKWNTGINGVEVYNNIFQTTTAIPLINIPAGYSAVFAGNLYWSTGDMFVVEDQGETYTSLEKWRQATGNEKNRNTSTGIVANPLLINSGTSPIVFPKTPDKLDAYKLPYNSPAINAGLDLKSLYGENSGLRDFYNNSAPTGKAPDIGAFEIADMGTFILEIKREENIKIFPNPVLGDLFTISLAEITLQGIPEISFYDLNGKLVNKIRVNPINKLLSAPHLKLEKGFYIVEARLDGKNYNNKIIIQ